ncbi:MAG: FAD-binding protein, partial [Spirochaetaceae bacterium]|nr:FAD-binding protein [Spirochaetaceae bacterium]
DKLGIAGDALHMTVSKYNADYKNGGDAVFGTSVDNMAPVEKGPFYAVKVSPVSSGEYATVIVDDKCRVLLREGQPITNLYACGGAMGNTFNKDGRGAGNMTALTTGALTGEVVRLELLQGK